MRERGLGYGFSARFVKASFYIYEVYLTREWRFDEKGNTG